MKLIVRLTTFLGGLIKALRPGVAESHSLWGVVFGHFHPWQKIAKATRGASASSSYWVLHSFRAGAWLPSLLLLVLCCVLTVDLAGQSGTAFRDFNGDGLQTGAEPGVQGIIVKLYANAAAPDKDILIGETVTGSGGTYDFGVSVTSGRAANIGEAVRLEFDIPTNFECGLEEGVDFTGQGGESYGTSVQFATGLESDLNFAINYPGQWVSTPNPIAILPCYVFGTANGDVASSPALVKYNFLDNGVPAAHSGNNSGTGSGDPGVAQAELLSSISEVGALYGVAFSRQAQKAFTSAVMRRHAAFGPLGPGGIYLVDPFSTATDKTDEWLNLDDIEIFTSDLNGSYPASPGNNTSPVSGYIGTDAERGLNILPDQPSTDYAAGDQVGKVSLGDIDISDDGRYLYVVNLYDRRVYEIDLVNPQDPQAPTLATKGDRVRSWPVPDPATQLIQGEERPWGLKYYRGKLYVGLVLSGQDINGEVVSPVSGSGDGRVGDGLRGYVYEFDTNTEVFTERLNFDFDYGRERPWIPWGYSGNSPLSRYFAGTEREVAAPIISDIEFDDQGSMLIGIMDRKGNQYAINNNDYNGTLVDYEYSSAGELLRADVSFSGDDCVYNIVTRAGTTDFYDDDLLHPESVQGALAILPGGGDAMATWLDPILIRSGGTIRLDNATGAQVSGSAYEVFDDRFTLQGGFQNEAAPSKANGLGDLELGGEPAGIEIGNLVWADYDEDGIQDSGEPGIPNVEVELWSGDDVTLLSTTTTNSEGGYYFNQLNVTDGDVNAPGNQAGLRPFVDYKLYVRATQYGTALPLGGFEPTLLDQTGSGKDDFSDHDGVAQGNGDLQVMFTTGTSGENNHTYDYGFQCVFDPTASFIPVPGGCDDLTALNDGYIVLATFATGTDRYGISTGGGAYSGPTFADATPIPAEGETVLEDIPNVGGTYVIRVFAGNELCFRDYTVIVPARNCPADPAGYIYCEDTGEIITGSTITVTPPAGGNVLIIKDGSDGEYIFYNDGTDGVYTLTVTPPVGYALSSTCTSSGQLNPGPGDPNPFVVGVDDVDNDGILDDASCGSNPFYLEFFLETGDEILLNNIPLSCGKIGDYVWEDNDLDGNQDIGLEPGVPDIEVNLYECTGGVKGTALATTTTDPNGAYCFTGLPGNVAYCVEFDLPNSTNPLAGLYTFTAPDQTTGGTDDTTDSDADANGCTPSIPLTPGQQYEDFDAGLTLVDLGDLPEDTGYNTTLANGGPSHSVPSTGAIVKIGGDVDIELDGQPSPDADGDGADEDGFDPNAQMFIRTQAVDLTIPVMNMTGGPAKLTMFVDWNNDGDFEAMYSDEVAPGDASALLTAVTPPADAVLNKELGVRIRISTDMTAAMSPNGPAPDGEVEDYEIVVMGFDYGDLADAGPGVGAEDYETAAASGGPVHKLSTNDSDEITLKIGATIDDELDGQPSADADSDGTDEDGFDPDAQMFIRTQAVDLTIPVMNMTGGPAKLTMFVDWNNDGDFEAMYADDVADGDPNALLVGVTPPADAILNKDLGVRIRISTDMTAAMSPNGPAPDGEVEDYEIVVMAFDYGDLADAGPGIGVQDYETAAANGGPQHKLSTNANDEITLKIGASIDDELDGQPSADADGDAADEDGFDPNAQMFIRYQPQDLTIPVMNMTGGPAKLTMFVDWNNDGDFEAMYSDEVAPGDASALLTAVTPPADAVLNKELGVRIRISTDMTAAMSPNGLAPDGEVEDYEIVVMGFDYGDLEDPVGGVAEENYETTTANGGAQHKLATNDNDEITLKLGSTIDDEVDGQPSVDADGDGDDEDGFVPADYMFVAGQTLDLNFTLMNMTNNPAKLTVFIDWNNNGDLSETGEMYFVDVPNGATTATVADVTPPLSATLNDLLGFRVRLSTDMAASMLPNGPAPDGEVEDYEILVMGFDYGDMIDPAAGLDEQNYETLVANNGPIHKIITNEADEVLLKIGSAADPDVDGQVSDDSSGDDADGIDDEDGLDIANMVFITGQPQDVTIPVMNMTDGPAKLTMFIDWNNDGDFDDVDEMYAEQVEDGENEAIFAGITPPTTATLNDELGLRLRISTDMDAVMSPVGPAPDGEVEDYEIVEVRGYDYGDLPDNEPGTDGDPNDPDTPADHETVADDDGAKHRVLTNEADEVILKMGLAADDEADASPAADAGETAGGDDNAGTPASDPDDEDALVEEDLPLFILTLTTTLEVPVMNMTGEPATLAAFIDYNKDGAFDPNTEKYTTTVAADATSVSIAIGPIPETAIVGQDVGLRLRLATEMGEIMTATGCAESGEVEDYFVEIIGYDYGDLPDTYVTTGDDAPRHIISEALKLGSCVDTEIDGFPEPMAGMMEGGDDADPGLATFGICEGGSDEDGIAFTHPIIPGNESCVTVSAMNMTGEDAVLQMWIDWNGDGSFGLGEELNFIDATVPVGGVDNAEYCFPVPADVAYSAGAVFVRARLSSEGGLTPDSQTVPAPFGEIEDYKVKLSKVGSLVWEDYDGNGEQNEGPERGLDGVDVELLWYGPDGIPSTADDNRLYTVTTTTVDGNPGVYNFCGLIPGDYSLSVPTLPTDFVPTWSDIPANEVIDSDEHTGVEFTIVDPMGLPEGENGISDNPGGINSFPDMQDDLRFDFGAYIPAELGDYVWLDESFDRADDTQVSTGTVPDVPIEGVMVTLMGTNNIGQAVMLQLVTDENGLYKFTDLAPGRYKVTFDASTALDACGPILLAVAQNALNGDDTTDSDQDADFVTSFYALFSGDDDTTVDGGFVEPPFDFGCITNINVTLDEDCRAEITEDMILTGQYYCIDEFIVTVDNTDNNIIDGCGNHTYSITLIEDGEEVYTCWGNIFAEDKTPPSLECPADTDEILTDLNLFFVAGALELDDPTLAISDYSCFSDFFDPIPGDYFYDVITFTPDVTGVYTFFTRTQFDGNISLYEGVLDPNHPCDGVLAHSDDTFTADDPTFPSIFDPIGRFAIPLRAGQTYSFLMTSTSPASTGTWAVSIYNDTSLDFGDIDFAAGDYTVSDEVLRVPFGLLCTDVDEILFPNTQRWVANAAGEPQGIASVNAGFFPNLAAFNAFVAQLSLTGVPTVGDNCGDIIVTLSDMLMENGDCGDIFINRTFQVTDRYQNCEDSFGDAGVRECTQRIDFRRPTVADVVLPPFAAPLDCLASFETDGSVGGSDDNPAASATGQPWLSSAFGLFPLDENVCNLGANYSDEPRLNVCDGTYKFRREWNIIDWCDQGNSTTYDQYIKVGDFRGPSLVSIPGLEILPGNEGGNDRIIVSTSPFDCVAYVSLPEPVLEDNCSLEGAYATYKITAATGGVVATGTFGDGRTTQAPLTEAGTAHTLTICTFDGCGNSWCDDYDLIVRDLIEPFASCDDQLNISIGGGDIANGIEGIHRVFAATAAEGSSDNCSEVTLEIRRQILSPQTYDCLDHFDYDGDGRIIGDEVSRDPLNFSAPNGWFTPWLPFADFTCCDVGVFDATDDDILVEVRVTDEAGNSNVCWMYVEPEDKLRPFCYAPADQSLSCVDLPLNFPGDIRAAYDEDTAGTVGMLNALFGAPTGTDNCRVDTLVELRPLTELNDCGWGTITRRFEVWQLNPAGDANGNGAIDRSEVLSSTNTCRQLITITETHNFVIDFPEDAEADCAEACIPGIIIEMPGCDNILVNRSEPQIFAASGDECYKLAYTYDVINWCIWDGEYEGTVIERRTEGDGVNGFDGPAVEHDERPVLTAFGPNAASLVTVLDRDHDLDPLRNDSCSVVNLPRVSDRGNSTLLNNTGIRGALNRGRWQYTQFVKVYDQTVPEVIDITYNRNEDITALCTQDQVLEDWQFVDPYGTCDAAVNITFAVTDLCDGLDGAIDNITLISSFLDGFAVDENRDGFIKANEFVADPIPFSLITNDGVNYTFTGTFPIIEDALGDNVYHALRVVFEDGCGNRGSEYILFDVIDCKGPAPSCINGITLTLMPQPEGGCAMATWAVDFEASPIYDCTGQGPALNPSNPAQERVTKLAIYLQDEVENDPEFVPSSDATGLTLTEDHLGQTFVYVYGFDEDGNYDYCTTYIEVEAHVDCGTGSGGNLSGVIVREGDDTTVEFVEVGLNGGMTTTVMTAADGAYDFGNVPVGGDYTVTPYRNDDHDNGVTTFDIVLISKHILGTDLLDTPYKRIAADVNRSGTVTTLDMIQIRKLILNIETEYTNNTSWRFVEAGYNFPNVEDPWAEAFPELYNVNNFSSAISDADFVAIKVGDVNNSARANSLEDDNRSLNGIFELELDEQELKTGNTYTIPVYASELAQMSGFQGTLQLEGVELVDLVYGLAEVQHFGLQFVEQGVVTMSYDRSGDDNGINPVMQLVLRATADQLLSEAVVISSRYTAAEAYSLGGEHRNLDLKFNGKAAIAEQFELYQNTPNPVATATLISFTLSEAGEATLTISDIAGRLILLNKAEYSAGFHTISVTEAQLNGVTGVLNYTLTAGEHTTTKQMVVVK